MTYVKKTQVYIPEDDLKELTRVSQRTGRSIAALIREAIRARWLSGAKDGPVGIWNGSAARTSVDHDSIYDDP